MTGEGRVGDGRSAPTGAGRSTDRLEAFSDGVIAIAITLLVLEIRVPEAHDLTSAALWHELRELWPAYLGYLISFAIIGIIWANHHQIFRHVGRTNHYLILINGLFLFCVAFIPFPTALLARYLGHPAERVGVIVYSGWIFLTALTYFLLWWYASANGRLLEPDANERVVRTITARFRLGPPSYLLAFVLSFFSTEASLLVLLALALLYVLPNAAADA